MENMKKTKYIWAITLVIAMLVISSAASVPASEETSTSSVSVVKRDMVAQTLQIQATEVPLEHMATAMDTGPAFAFEGDQLHPAFGRVLDGTQMAAYRDEEAAQVIWTFSAEHGVS